MELRKYQIGDVVHKLLLIKEGDRYRIVNAGDVVVSKSYISRLTAEAHVECNGILHKGARYGLCAKSDPHIELVGDKRVRCYSFITKEHVVDSVGALYETSAHECIKTVISYENNRKKSNFELGDMVNVVVFSIDGDSGEYIKTIVCGEHIVTDFFQSSDDKVRLEVEGCGTFYEDLDSECLSTDWIPFEYNGVDMGDCVAFVSKSDVFKSFDSLVESDIFKTYIKKTLDEYTCLPIDDIVFLNGIADAPLCFEKYKQISFRVI